MRRLILLGAITALVTGWAQRVEYQGPTILSRGLGTVMQGGGSLLRLRPYLSITGVYDTGLTPVAVDANGTIPQEDLYGGNVEFGVYGYRAWRHSLLGLDYRGSVRHYTRNTYYDGSDHHLTLGYTHQPTRQLAFTLREGAGTSSRNYGMYSGYAYFDPAYANVPVNDLFNGRIYYASTMGDLTYLKSQRLSFNFGGTGLVVRRRSRVLIGVTGWTGRADLQYRLGPTAAIGADYDFTHYEFTNAFGASDIHTAAVDFSFRLGRSWDLGLRAGGARVETLGLRRVAVDPVVAAIIGQTSGIEAVYRLNYIPSGQARLSRAFRRSTLSFNYSTGISPGNGIYLTSRSQNAGLGYSHTAFRRWSFGISAGYSTFTSLSQTIGKYQSYNAGGGISCQVNSWTHIVSRFDARRYDVQQSVMRRLTYSASLGIAFSPGDLPLSLW